MSITIDTLSLIRPPSVEATAERHTEGDFILRWRPEATGVQVFAGRSADTIDRNRPLKKNSLGPGAWLVDGAGLPPRPIFELQAADGRSVQAAERILPLQGAINFRDIGGYAAHDGRQVIWGRVFRAASLAYLTGADLLLLADLGVRVSCDLRQATEVAGYPDRLPPGVRPWHLPVGGKVGRGRRLMTLLRKRNRMREVMEDAYTHVMIDQNGDVFGELFRRLADPAELPMIIHCTAGKDRTGMAVAVLLSALGVDDETIAADYSLSNAYAPIFAEQMAGEIRRLQGFGIKDSQIQALFLAYPETILGALAYMRGRYGSVHNYLLRMSGVGPETLQQVQDNLLT